MNSLQTMSTTPSIAAQQRYWDQRWHRQSEPNRWQSRRSDTVLAFARELPLDNPRALDLGCGTGFTTSALSDFGTAEGIDLSPKAIEIARGLYPGVRYTAGDLFEADYDDGSFDLVVCQEVIPHVIDQAGLVERVARWIRSRGFVIMTAANKFVMTRLKGGDGGPVGSGPLDPNEHIKRWLSTRELRMLMKPHFDILKTTSVIPVGNRGVLRLINSPKINNAVAHVIPSQQLERIKGRLGWCYTIIVVGQKRR